MKVYVCNREGDCVPVKNLPNFVLDGDRLNIMDDDVEAITDAIKETADDLELHPPRKRWSWGDNFDMKKQRGKNERKDA